MLKIKDSVDLKELEKFGFEYEEEDRENWYERDVGDYEHKIFILKDKSIRQGRFELIYGFSEVVLNEDNIQDLVQAGLVEKVSD